ncbi:MAG: hypothetical protein A3C93_01365 [Candidatus Lloydbacteria bacterium RIFCSPHIGHO2_02_FULL_54_17]|uniref:Uncharacterized protein n=1 Tax=Candidatus Lloydbacteria bacterium RIFCSPHIGHO2_02_FULL_54_17 TaxID=1798664 RepID=A0A1G2DEM7_9BACT|nr:MAG: hypothetical protein A2762_00130 [Candidatus Lloydbacteria bacterium RIFCSPHIGHO2_01_FULL_54_11]OGZ12003.1 MAG: hypothetical protein A3C93_01365 [Candidatus Lloydbacteria bacterium RIFCSPHIGHO2_02_FULL_54_17]OGZ14022.1 MAG: hypothetical protein A2948_01020 [Candidatus Lloydbacteria bacterium RIFCSPLOWO2_01_FULL_54_18]OGZ15457.1 MAG: hypothetical protein A3H76_05930 [Candidatus Lloydbacteria bacterium RIFCSPLOWO2_02_FULL_54_12]
MCQDAKKPFCNFCGTDPGWEQRIIQSEHSGVGICSMCVDIFDGTEFACVDHERMARFPKVAPCDFCATEFEVTERQFANGANICFKCLAECALVLLEHETLSNSHWKLVIANPKV